MEGLGEMVTPKGFLGTMETIPAQQILGNLLGKRFLYSILFFRPLFGHSQRQWLGSNISLVYTKKGAIRLWSCPLAWLAWHGEEIPGRLCRGVVTSGLAYSLDPYGNRVVVAEIRGEAQDADLAVLRWAAARGLALMAMLRVSPLEQVDLDRLFARLLDDTQWAGFAQADRPR